MICAQLESVEPLLCLSPGTVEYAVAADKLSTSIWHGEQWTGIGVQSTFEPNGITFSHLPILASYSR